MASKVDGIFKTINVDGIEEFYFKISVPDGYRLKTTEPSSIDGTYLTESEAKELLKKLHIKTDSILLNVFKLDFEKEAYLNRILSSIHDLGRLKQELMTSTITKEDLVADVNLLKVLTKDSELASLDVKGMQQEELYNIVHRKHLEYYSKFKDIILTECY